MFQELIIIRNKNGLKPQLSSTERNDLDMKIIEAIMITLTDEYENWIEEKTKEIY